MDADILHILQDGVTAPSGENCQPWKFVVKGGTVSLFNVPDADTSLYNSQQKGSYIAHGALIENITISAQSKGYVSTVVLFPNEKDVTHVADVTFEKSETQTHPLYEVLRARCTNRKDFTGENLSDKDKRELMAASQSKTTTLILVDDKTTVRKIGTSLGLHELVLFENKYLHDFFYDHILWDKKDEGKSGGFYITTLEFLPHQLKAVTLFKSWFALSILNRILGVSKMISKENGEKYAASGTFGAVTMTGNAPRDYVEAGRSLEKMWLTATKLNLALHPCNGITYLVDHINDNGGVEFSEKHSSLLKSAYKTIQEEFGAGDNKLAFVFRIGKASAPSARSSRLDPVIEWVSH